MATERKENIPQSSSSVRAQREAEALRANLYKRKKQAALRQSREDGELNKKQVDTQLNLVMRINWKLVLLIFFLTFGAIRSFCIILHDPVLGFGNNFDPVRIQYCHGIWAEEQLAFSTPDKATIEFPNKNYYVTGWTLPETCYISSVLLLDAPIINLHKLLYGSKVPLDIRWVGGARAGMLLIIISLYCYLFYSNKFLISLSISLFYSIVLSDPFITLFANTFYQYYGAILFLVFNVLSFVYIYINIDYKLGFKSVGVFFLSTILAAMSLNQLRYLPILFCCALLDRRFLRRKMIVATILCSTMVIPLGNYFDKNIEEAKARKFYNNLNVYYYVILPTASDVNKMLGSFDLPSSCGIQLDPAARNTLPGWYWLKDKPEKNGVICPQAGAIDKLDILKYLTEHPMVFYKAMKKIFENKGDSELIINYPGQVHGELFGKIVLRYFKYYSISHIWGKIMEEVGYFSIILVVLFLNFIYSLVKLSRIVPFIFSNLFLLYFCTSAVFGDGYEALSRHLIFFNITILAMAINFFTITFSRR